MKRRAVQRTRVVAFRLPSGMGMHAQPLLHWVLRHGHDALTCQVQALAPRTFDVSVVPHWNQSSAVTERFESANDAVRRHAEIVGLLRERGWRSTEYGRGRSSGISAA